jgi:hypothetical protein
VRVPHRARRPQFPYDSDGLRVIGKNVPFLADERFMSAYRRGMNSGHDYGKGGDIHIEWRVAVSCWAARHGANLPGDFVECGVNTGIHSLAICEYVGFNALSKRFYLFDTFCGIPDEQRSAQERAHAANHEYRECYELACANFAPYPGAVLVRGKVPDTLPTVLIEQVAYLSIDMNIAYPERKAIEYFWPKLATGALIVLDDYGWRGYEEQKTAMDEFARGAGVEVLTLPTGQGLLVKP